MQRARVTWRGEEQFVAVGESGYTVLLDADRVRNTGPGPMELLLLALGGCTGADVVSILKKKRQRLSRLEIQVEGERASQPPRVWRKLRVHYHLAGEKLEPQAVEHAIELSRSKYCSVAATLSVLAEIEWSHRIEEESVPPSTD